MSEEQLHSTAAAILHLEIKLMIPTQGQGKWLNEDHS